MVEICFFYHFAPEFEIKFGVQSVCETLT